MLVDDDWRRVIELPGTTTKGIMLHGWDDAPGTIVMQNFCAGTIKRLTFVDGGVPLQQINLTGDVFAADAMFADVDAYRLKVSIVTALGVTKSTNFHAASF